MNFDVVIVMIYIVFLFICGCFCKVVMLVNVLFFNENIEIFLGKGGLGSRGW